MNVPGVILISNDDYTRVVSLTIFGIPSVNSRGFAINLQRGPNVNPRDDVGLHLFFDFQSRRIVRNSIIQGSWGQVVDEGDLILTPHSPFKIMIECDRDCFQIFINGHFVTTFGYRMPMEDIKYLAVDGDVVIHNIEVIPPVFKGHSRTANTPSAPFIRNNMPHPISGRICPPYPVNSSVPQVPMYSPYSPASAYPSNPSLPNQQSYPSNPYPSSYSNTYPTQPIGGSPFPPNTGYPPNSNHGPKGLMDKAGMAAAGALGGLGLLGAVGAGKMTKSPKKLIKAQKKALKYGLPIAGVVGGSYLLSKGFRHHRRSSSSSSSSSD